MSLACFLGSQTGSHCLQLSRGLILRHAPLARHGRCFLQNKIACKNDKSFGFPLYGNRNNPPSNEDFPFASAPISHRRDHNGLHENGRLALRSNHVDRRTTMNLDCKHDIYNLYHIHHYECIWHNRHRTL
ncbi:hypothetical protein M5689_008023 [Euphorbia peplus]|nr:hypothetical protein M5689_008023 [Euphorbia peplus]